MFQLMLIQWPRIDVDCRGHCPGDGHGTYRVAISSVLTWVAMASLATVSTSTTTAYAIGTTAALAVAALWTLKAHGACRRNTWLPRVARSKALASSGVNGGFPRSLSWHSNRKTKLFYNHVFVGHIDRHIVSYLNSLNSLRNEADPGSKRGVRS